MSRAAHSPRLWLPVSLFAVAVVLVPLAWRLLHPAPKDSIAFAQRIGRPGWRSVPVSGASKDGCYLCRPDFEGDPTRLIAMPRTMQHWQGVVLVTPDLSGSNDEQVREYWGEHGVYWQGHVIVGDPEMLAEIAR